VDSVIKEDLRSVTLDLGALYAMTDLEMSTLRLPVTCSALGKSI